MITVVHNITVGMLMTCNVFGGMLNLAQSSIHAKSSVKMSLAVAWHGCQFV